jgi:two-component system, LytTR family, response regulator LytT
MKIVIIEDEILTAEDLADTIVKAEPASRITAILHSVKEAISYFNENEEPDLVFSDIQLGDGLSFEIFKTVPVAAPVIFCTAFDEYALNAFKANGIDYILKPFTKKTISEALRKYRELKHKFSRKISAYESMTELLERRNTRQDTSVLVYFKEKILPVSTSDIALFYIEKKDMTHFVTFDQKIHITNKPLEELERLAGPGFYRVNRRVLINRKAIRDASQFFHRKLLINLSIPFVPKEHITVSKLRVQGFLNWLSGIE